MAHNGQKQANQRQRLVLCSTGGGVKCPLSVSGNLLSTKSTEYFDPVRHALALSASAVLAANSSTVAVRAATR